jgi:hypothetical protein
VAIEVGNKLQAFQAEFAGNSQGLLSFANSRYGRVYDRERLRARNVEDAWQLVQDFLHLIATKTAFSVRRAGGRCQFIRADAFFRTLQSHFDKKKIPLTTQPGDSEERKEWAAGETLVRCWTATSLCQPLQREWCSLLQQAVRSDDPDLVFVVAKIWATMAVYCVANRKGGKAVKRDVAWPGEGKGHDPAEEHRILHRGARLHEKTLAWWDEACATKEVFRVPGAIAVSKLSKKALYFMTRQAKPDDQAMVYYRFHLYPIGEQPCDHAVCLDTISVVPEEQEFLFPPFSSFQALSKTWFRNGSGGFWIIDVAVAKDNKQVSADVPLCPWL